jgi:hypothetical protein
LVYALVEQLVDVGADSERLVRLAAYEVAMRDIVRSRRSVVHFAGKETGGGGRLRGPRVAEGGGGEEAEVMAVGALSFDDPEASVLALDGMDMHGLEQVQHGVRHIMFRTRWMMLSRLAWFVQFAPQFVLPANGFDSDVAYGTPVPLNLAVVGRQRDDGMSPAFQ